MAERYAQAGCRNPRPSGKRLSPTRVHPPPRRVLKIGVRSRSWVASLVIGAALLLLPLGGGAAPAGSTPVGTCLGREVTVVVGPDRTHVRGTPIADVILDRSGNHTIYGRGGNDRICAGRGGDRIFGGGGSDRIVAGGGSDMLE